MLPDLPRLRTAEKPQATWSLIGGRTCTYTTLRGDMTVTWTMRPVQFLPLVHRANSRRPACSKRFPAYPFRPLLTSPPQPH
ncbi:hypothetical protein [Streptomyces sp. I05A-00742]|uniref:hypothetical protein n=1 Tax=Streptomyces sp. I05A-00742 TaxID=2732853 RepID=UPI0014889A88|nr:hypothetical protein [Streptomyces sp. I05A-00742]